jgi:hypothetical protein
MHKPLNFNEDCSEIIIAIETKAKQTKNRIELDRQLKHAQIKAECELLEPILRNIIKVGRALLDNGFNIGHLFCRPSPSGLEKWLNFGFVMHEQDMRDPGWHPEGGEYEIDGIGFTSQKCYASLSDKQHLFFLYDDADGYWTEAAPAFTSETYRPHIKPDSVCLEDKIADFKRRTGSFEDKLSEYVNRIVTCKDTRNIRHLLREV